MKNIKKSIIIHYKKQNRQQNYEKKQYQFNKRRALIRKQTKQSDNQNKMKESKKKNLAEAIDNGCFFFELATSNKIYVNGLKVHQNQINFIRL